MVYDGIIIGLIVGLFRGGLKHGLVQFSNIRLKSGWIFPLLLVFQFFMFYIQERSSTVAAASGYIYIAVYVVGLIFLWLNRHNKGFWLIMIGVFLNFLVMLVNGGRMPVSYEAASVLDPIYLEMLRSGDAVTKHYLLDASTRLAFLGDIIPLSSPYPRTQAISIGDVVMNFGIFLFIVNIMTPAATTGKPQPDVQG
ncbi:MULTISPECIES: DUF5317 domain-containing protein [unclassified Paenibacillus]|uniref:DUF5317 domain-containing protein n=1 Tax=unclassified Paenibacillus TaxID=185978 RepID=UPI002404D4AD|nr:MULTISPECIES: DUF5317 domain-containing protein [unclassified Paenibacillus]MDF9840934.1 hypothetical protein [Paenibacillus sp. PastF-2]MDF9847518.1 hypothetical protein [Paenibacillus sp. PastM-2]MDF9853906.1 hypothetical protein [Paenibacillus sp. PastF-1]MDH6479177.1 hypothetical protein [Paenibacillus sp. PastH-2]MDH6507086.1 hypothetical protein [Paenibacillus sp. PastM-3]